MFCNSNAPSLNRVFKAFVHSSSQKLAADSWRGVFFLPFVSEVDMTFVRLKEYVPLVPIVNFVRRREKRNLFGLAPLLKEKLKGLGVLNSVARDKSTSIGRYNHPAADQVVPDHERN